MRIPDSCGVLSWIVGLCLLVPANVLGDTGLIAIPQGAQPMDALNDHPLVREIEPVFGVEERKTLTALGQVDLARTLKMVVRSDEDFATLLKWIRDQKLNILIERNAKAEGQSDTSNERAEPLERLQWGLKNDGSGRKLYIDDLTTVKIAGKKGEDIGLTQIPVNAGSTKPVVVAILDTGLDAAHPDFAGQILRKESECIALQAYRACLKDGKRSECDERLATVDTDGDGYPLDCMGWNVSAGKNRNTDVFGNPDTDDDVGHGTHVAGIVGASTNGLGIRGVAEHVAILPVKVIRSSPNQPIRPQDDSLRSGDGTGHVIPFPKEKELRWGSTFADVIARGMLYAIRNRAQVINLSLAWPAGADSELMRRMVTLAQDQGALVVAAAGNDSADSRVFPCSYSGVICVAAHGPDGSLSHFSNFGSFVDVAAPGLGILSTWPQGKRTVNYTAFDGYEMKNGTSMAAPFVSGLLARMLAAGMSAEEAYARLLSGSRPHQAAEYLGASGIFKHTRSGNADFGKSCEIEARPLILAEKKEVVRIRWDGVSSDLSFEVELKNVWEKASEIHIRGRLLNEAGRTLALQLKSSDWQFDSWAKAERKSLRLQINNFSNDLEGRLLLELVIRSGHPEHEQRLFVPIEIFVELGTGTNSGHSVQKLPVKTQFPLPNWLTFRTVTPIDGKSGQDYFAIDDRSPNWRLHLLADRGDHYELSASAQITGAEGELYLTQRLDYDGDGSSEYVILFRLPATQQSRIPRFRFLILDRNLRTVAQLDHDNRISVLTEGFRWLRIEENGTPKLVPSWVGLGTTPPQEVPEFDPWNPRTVDAPRLRLYYLTTEGVRSVSPGSDHLLFIQMLQPSGEQLAQGSIPVLLARGGDYRLEYFSGVVRNGRLIEVREFPLSRYRMLAGLSSGQEWLRLEGSARKHGTVFTGPGTRGALRLTAVEPAAVSVDYTVHPPSIAESVMQLVGLFSGEKHFTFTQLHYELQFTEHTRSGELLQRASTSLDRFSFLPSFIFQRSLFPVTVSSFEVPASHGPKSQLPGVLVPAALGSFEGIEVVIPRYDGAGNLLGLTRPARFRMLPSRDCEMIGNPLPAEAATPTRMVFFCGDHFLRVALSL